MSRAEGHKLDFWTYLLSTCINHKQFRVYGYLNTVYTQCTEVLTSVLNRAAASDIKLCKLRPEVT